MAYWELHHDNLRKQVRSQVSGLLTVRDGKPYLPIAAALVSVGAEVAARSEIEREDASLEAFDQLAKALMEQLRDEMKAYRERKFLQ